VTTFLVIVITTVTLSAFQVIVSPVFFVNSAAKESNFHQGGWWQSPGVVRPIATPLNWEAFWSVRCANRWKDFRLI